MERILRFIKIIIWLLPLFIFVFLLSKNLMIFGSVSASYQMKQNSPFISLAPVDRMSTPMHDLHGWYRKVISEPVYFDIRLPIQCQKITLKIKYSNQDQNLLELGGMVNQTENAIFLQPLENKIIDDLSWFRVTDGEFWLWQKERKYQSFFQFVKNPPPARQVALYRADFGAGKYQNFDIAKFLTPENEVKYLVSAYYPVSSDNFIKEKIVEFDLSKLEFVGNKYRFVLSAPGILPIKDVRLYEVSFVVVRPPLTFEKFKEIFFQKFNLIRNRFDFLLSEKIAN